MLPELTPVLMLEQHAALDAVYRTTRDVRVWACAGGAGEESALAAASLISRYGRILDDIGRLDDAVQQ